MHRICGTLAGLAMGLLASPCIAQAYPDKPLRVIVPVPAGGTPDVLSRTVSPGISALLGQSLVIDNRGGAGGRIGAELAAKATPDGYTLFLTSPGALTIVPHIGKNVPYDTFRDFVPIALISTGPFLLITHPSAPARTVKELIALAKAERGKLTYGSGGNGTANHLGMELFKSMAGINLLHIPYRGAPLTVTDILAGRITATLNSIPPVLSHIREGRLRALGVAAVKRSPQLPEVPTVSEAGVPGFEWASWLGLLAPAKTPKRIITRLNEVTVEAVRVAQLRFRLEELGADPVGSSPEEFSIRLRREWDLNAKIVKLADVKVD